MTTLFDPIKIGALELPNRIIMAPLTRARAIGEGRVPNELMAEYYVQRASAGLILSEATSVTPMGVGYADTPGIWSDEQVAGWKKVTDAVHAAGGRIVLQLWHVGRISDPVFLDGAAPVAPSAIKPAGTVSLVRPKREYTTPRALETAEIAEVVAAYRKGAENAKLAGFDGVEVHGANGYLLSQFLNPHSNQRTDEYGGSVRNRARFVLEVARGVADAIGAERTGIRLSPWGTDADMPHYPEMDETYAYLAEELQKIGLVYMHLVDHSSMGAPAVPAETVTTIRRLFTNTLILSGGYTTVERAEEALQSSRADLVAFGKPFISNPDLVERLKTGAALAAYDVNTFYAAGPEGYTDYPTADGQPAGTFSPSYQA